MNRQVNPLDQSDQTTVVNLLLDYIDPPSLLNCRLVNRTWYRQATARLKRAGWRIHLFHDRAEKYLRLLQITDRDTDDQQSHLSLASYNQKDRLELCMHVLGSRMEIRLAAEISTHYLVPLINELHLELNNSRRQLKELAPSLHWLLVSTSASLQYISVLLESGESNWIGSTFGLEEIPKLPLLKIICIEYKDQTVGMVAATLQELTAKAGPNLDQIHVKPNLLNSIEDENPSNEIPVLPSVLCGIVGSHLIANLVELDINVRGDDLGQYVGRLRLDRLVKLRTTGAELTGLTRFVRDCCPTLHSLEIEDPDASQEQAENPQHPHEEFVNVTHFGLYVRQRGTCPMASWKTLVFMKTFSNLTSISTNFHTLVALAENGGIHLIGSEWIHVRKLHVRVPKPCASCLKQNVHVPRLHRVCDIINQIYPNLHQLVITLGIMDISIVGLHAKLAYALGLALGIRSVKHVTIENMHDKWYLGGIMREDFPWPIKLGLQQRDISNLESLTLRVISNWDCRRRKLGDWNRPGPECLSSLSTDDFDLTAFLTLLPRQCPNLLVRVERDLVRFGHSRARRPENPNLEQIQDMTNPRVELI